MAYPEDIKAKEKRREELTLENLDKQIVSYYSQRWKGNKNVQDYTEVKYASGRIVRTTNQLGGIIGNSCLPSDSFREQSAS